MYLININLGSVPLPSDQFLSCFYSPLSFTLQDILILQSQSHPAAFLPSDIIDSWPVSLIKSTTLLYISWKKSYGKPAHTLKISLDVSMLEGNLSSFSFPLSPSPPLPPLLSLCRTISQTSLDLSIMRQRGRLCIFAVTLSKAETELQILITAGEGDVCPQYKHNQYQYLYNIE